MAWTVSINEKSVFGNLKVHFISFTADSAEANITTGLDVVRGFSIGQNSFTSAPRFKMNVDSTGTASLGKIGVSGAVSGDIGFLVVYGN